jgi:hypothetical protein
LRTPEASSRDSDDVLVALETARSLEVRGDLVEAARWLRRAANEAEKQGNDRRVLAIAHAAADLSATAPVPAIRSSVSKTPPPLPRPRDPEDSEPTLHWRTEPAPIPAHASPPPGASPPISFFRERAIKAEQPIAQHQTHMSAIRVAVKKSAPNACSYSVERLDADQPLPPGTVEALLVLASDIDESLDLEVHPSGAQFVERK